MEALGGLNSCVHEGNTAVFLPHYTDSQGRWLARSPTKLLS